MICQACIGSGKRLNVPTDVCLACGGSGVAYCCEGDDVDKAASVEFDWEALQ